MSDAEYFLMAWAVIATVVAGFYANKAHNAHKAVETLMFAVSEVAEGKATISMVGNSVRIKQNEE